MRESWSNRYRYHEKTFFFTLDLHPRPRPSTCYPRPSNQFALCFGVLSNLYVERSAYANVFKFNREKKHFDGAKVNSRCFHWFPVAMFILNTIIFSDILCQTNNLSSEYRTSPERLHVVYLLLFYDIWISWLNLLNGKRFYFSLAW